MMQKLKAFLKAHRRGAMTTLTVAVIILVLAANIGLAWLAEDRVLYGDMTPEGLYTLSDKMKETCSRLASDATILFCSDPDRLLSNYELRYVYVMAKQLELETGRVRVETCDLTRDPTAVNAYKASSAVTISADDVIVTSGGRYRIVDGTSFWTVGENSGSDKDYYSFNGEFKMATLLLSVTQVKDPIVAFTYGHGETVYVPEERRGEVPAEVLAASDDDKSSFYYLLTNAGMRVTYINPDLEDVPEGCLLVVTDGPKADFSVGDIYSVGEVTPLKRLHSYLSERCGAMMLFKDPQYVLPNLETFAADWGISYLDGYYLRETPENALADAEGSCRRIFANLVADESSISNNVYSDILALGSVPRTVVADSGIVSGSWKHDGVGGSSTTQIIGYYGDFLTTSPDARPGRIDGGGYREAGTYAMAGLSVRSRLDSTENVRYNAYFFGAASTSLTSNTYLDNRAYCNADLLFTTVRYIARTDAYASMELGGTSLNSPIPGGKVLKTVTLAEGGNKKYDKEEGVVIGYYRAVDRTAQVTWGVLLTLTPALTAAVVGSILLIRRKNR